ncbi:MAG: FHA domain-containing protein [Pirellulales bacterium]
MTHITLSKRATAKPSLEFFSDGGGEAKRVTIEQFPFRIGRAESADLRIESVQVSREHAEILERNGVWLVRDLGSTNGTQINGKAIREALLADGDILKIAETELTFIGSGASQFQRMLTQPIQARKVFNGPQTLPPEVTAMRSLVEATLHQVVPIELLAATSLKHNMVEAYFAPSTLPTAIDSIADRPHPVGDRYRELERLRTIEAVNHRTDIQRLFLAVGAADLEIPHRLFATLKHLSGHLPAGLELGITIALPGDAEVAQFENVHHEAQENDLLVAYGDFQGTGAQVLNLKAQLPDYLVLSPSMVRDLTTNRQPLRRLESLLEACNELAIKPILPLESGGAAALCQQIGFELLLQRSVTTRAPLPAVVSVTT